jgi:hypothetical protein
MANYFPCPNPACTYQFDAEQLPSAAMVTCPICRTRFPYRAAQAPQPAPIKTAVEPAPTYPDESGFGSQERHPASAPRPNRLVTLRNVPKSSRSNTALMALGGAVVVATILVCFVLAIKYYRPGSDKKPEEIHTYPEAEGNFKFRTFDKEVWREENTLKHAMKAVGFVMRRNDPDAWVVVHYHDFKTRNPRPEEMRNELFGMLKRSMQSPETKPLPKAQVGDSPAEAFEFQATLANKDLYGEALAFHNRGFGYVLMFFSTSADWEKAKKELDEYRNSFACADFRSKWTETESDSTPLFEKDMPYQLADPDKVWNKARIIEDDELPKGREFVMTKEKLKEQDEKATMYLKYSRDKDFFPTEAMVLELDKTDGDPLETARKYMLAMLQKEEGADAKVTFEPANKTISGNPLPKKTAAVGVFRFTTDQDRSKKRYYAMSAMPIGDKLVVAVAWCREIDSELYEGNMLNLVASLRERR